MTFGIAFLNKTIWGVDFHLLCDRDAVNLLGPAQLSSVAQKNIKILPRYHLENYFLDEQVLARVFSMIEPDGSLLRDPLTVKSRLLELAKSVIPYAVALNVAATIREKVGNISIMPKALSDVRSADELAAKIISRVGAEGVRVAAGLNEKEIAALIGEEHARLTKAVEIDDLTWRTDLPGRVILNRFAASANFQVGRLKQLYLANAEKSVVFAEIIALFEQFRSGT